MGGEKTCSAVLVILLRGSPPRGRGKGYRPRLPAPRQRITPAWAGKRHLPYVKQADYRDHPRVGGEKKPANWWKRPRRGSPPRGRGKAFSTQGIGSKNGITPAWAGKSVDGFCDFFGIQDHPRVGGEKISKFTKRTALRGSPPRGRGKAASGSMVGATLRITPAWAGKSFLVSAAALAVEDHPRVGGEKLACDFGTQNATVDHPRVGGEKCSANKNVFWV